MLEVSVIVNKPLEEVWSAWTSPADIRQWNIPFDDWHCPVAENDAQTGGKFFYRMESVDGMDGFDYKGTYRNVVENTLIDSIGDDGRASVVQFQQIENISLITEVYEPESKTPLHIQKNFTQTILNNFKKHCEDKA